MNIRYLMTVGCNRLRYCMRPKSSELRRLRNAEQDIRTYAAELVLHRVNREQAVALMMHKADELRQMK